MVLEIVVPRFGALGIGGAVAFVLGSVILFDDEAGQVAVAIPVILTFTLLSMALFIGVVGYAVKTRRKPVVSGREQLVGAMGDALEDFDDAGQVRVHGEIWRATTTEPLHRGDTVKVVSMDGLTLSVESAKEKTS